MRTPMLILTSLTLIGLIGCGSPHQKMQKKMINLQNEYADILSGIKSNTDLVDAKPKLERLGAKMKDLSNDAQKLPVPTADEEQKLSKEFEADSKKVTERISNEMNRLSKLGISPFELMDAMKMDPTELAH